MRRFNQKVLRILDGSPGALGGYQRGQSLVELLLITPLLIIMVAGIIEIGWYANHVLILLEVTRVGARQATLFTGEYGYQVWPNAASTHPVAYSLNNGINPDKPMWATWPGTTAAHFTTPGSLPPVEASTFRKCEPQTLAVSKGFYNSIACSMMNALEPLTLKGRMPYDNTIIAKRIRKEYNAPGTLIGEEYDGGRLWYTYDFDELHLFPDDIIVSVFAVQAINNATDDDRKKILTPAPTPIGTPITAPLPTVDANLYARTYNFDDRFPRGYQVAVVGRYPTNANECNVTFTPTIGPGTASTPAQTAAGENNLAIGESYLQRVFTMAAADNDYKWRSTFDTDASAEIKAPHYMVGGTYKYETYNYADKTTWQFRDPFEYFGKASPETDLEVKRNEFNGRYVELSGLDKSPEIQRGFVFTGQHMLDDVLDPATGRQLFCLGSEWSTDRVQLMMNSPSFLQKGIVMPPDGDPYGPNSATWRSNTANYNLYLEWQERAKFLPSQGVVLVEMFWRHDILLDFPMMSPIIRLMEGAGGPYDIVISVWAVFPLPGAEPNMNYGFPPK